MNFELASDFWSWVNDHADADTADLRLRYGRVRPMEITQIECRRKGRKKLERTLAANPRWLFAEPLAVEQATSDALAAWHASLVALGESVIDLTAGAGIDALWMARRGCRVTTVELDAARAEALRHNLPDVEVIEGDCREVLTQAADRHWDVAFIDPGRRGADGGRLFSLHDCQPDVTAMMDLIMARADRLIIKASPMLDMTAVSRELDRCGRITALGTTRECKEIVIDTAGEGFAAVTLDGDGVILSEISFTREEEQNAEPKFCDAIQPGQCLFDPYPSVMKAGCFRLLCQRYGVSALGPNTHVYVGDAEGFPGRRWQIEEVIEYTSGNLRRLARRGIGRSTDIMAANFDATAAELAKRLVTPKGNAPIAAIMGVSDAAGRRWLLILS